MYGSGMAHPLASKPALPASVLVDLAALERAYFDDHRTCRSPISASRSTRPDIAGARRDDRSTRITSSRSPLLSPTTARRTTSAVRS